MKQIVYILLTCILTVTVACCSDPARTRLRETARQLNRELPIEISISVTMDSASYDDDSNTFVFSYSLSEEFNTLQSMQGAHDSQMRYLKHYMSSDEGRHFFQSLVDADANIRLEFVGKITKEKVALDFYNDELRDILADQNQRVSDIEMLGDLISIINKQCPVPIDGENLVVKGVNLSDSTLEYHYGYNPEKYNYRIYTNGQLKSMLEPGLMKELKAPGNSNQLNLLKKLGFGLTCHFEADSCETIIVNFTNKEIAQ